MAFEGSVIQTLASGVNGLLSVENALYILADGRSISKTTYPALYAVISGRYGETGGNFTIPDCRGYYLRPDGLDSGRDADLASRVLYGPNVTASGVGTYQPAAGFEHSHEIQCGDNTPFGFEGDRRNIRNIDAPGPSVASSGIGDGLFFSPPTATTSGIDIASGFMNPASYTFYTYIKAT